MQLLTNIQNQGQAYDYFTEYCLNQLVPNMVRDVSKYAPNRYRLWLINEPYLGRQPRLASAYLDPYLKKVIQWLYPGCNTALISYHGQSQEFYSNAQITHHRDAGFAFATARILNLNNMAQFSRASKSSLVSQCGLGTAANEVGSYPLNLSSRITGGTPELRCFAKRALTFPHEQLTHPLGYDLARELGYCSGQEVRFGEQWICWSGAWEQWEAAEGRGISEEDNEAKPKLMFYLF